MPKPLAYLFLFLLVLAGAWITFEIEKQIFTAIAPHWSAIEAFFETESVVRRNYTENIPLLLGALFAVGTPVLYSALSGYALFYIERQHGAKRLSDAFMRRALIVTLALVFVGGALVTAGRGHNIPLQMWGGGVILFGIISLFSTAWAYRFFGRKR